MKNPSVRTLKFSFVLSQEFLEPKNNAKIGTMVGSQASRQFYQLRIISSSSYYNKNTADWVAYAAELYFLQL